ncbi:hypothetical protein HRbin17_00911 [bacterium HR17]|jgi:hypothetical protein|uniref:Uncharacterized protein n=1 Tax=Candidatus Fervidibacter japonicus TaxID=2035412 RepID=A0A2H5XB36_9BACT|nr:hypothetical protein HRbin17_00911 [bacterium HR17]
MSERRKKNILRQLQAMEQKLRHLQRLLESGELGEQLQTLADIGDHWHFVRTQFVLELLERSLLRATRTEEISDIADEVLYWLQRLRLS